MANEGADVAAEAGTAGRNPMSITGGCEGSLRLATCSCARAARGATVGSSLWARTAGLNTGGGATVRRAPVVLRYRAAMEPLPAGEPAPGSVRRRTSARVS